MYELYVLFTDYIDGLLCRLHFLPGSYLDFTRDDTCENLEICDFIYG